MDLSVIIPAYNEEDYLPKTIQKINDALANQRLSGWQWEIIVCDNNSSDNTSAIAEQLGAKVVFEPENQISKARNKGAAFSTGRWLLFVDADTYPTAELISEIFEIIAEDLLIGCGVTVLVKDGSLFNQLRMERLNPVFRILKLSGGAFLLCKREGFEAIKGFSERLYAYEEIDFIFRLRRYGNSIKKRFVVLHKNPVITSGRKGGANVKSILKTIFSNFFALILFLLHYILPIKTVHKIGKGLLGYWYSERKGLK
ncbi:MAG: glycosyltransferase [Bacteroidota bacterium]